MVPKLLTYNPHCDDKRKVANGQSSNVSVKQAKISQKDHGRKHQTDLSVPRRCSRVMVKMACEREEAAFIAVEPTVRAEFPTSRQPTISLAENTCLSFKPTIWKTFLLE